MADRLGVGAGGRGPSVAWWRRDSRMATALLLLMATLAAGAVVTPPVPAQAQVNGHHALTWNSNGARWDEVRGLTDHYDVIAIQEAGTRDPAGTGQFDTGTVTGNSWTSPSGNWTVNEYTWRMGSGTRGRTVYLYYLDMPATAIRNSLAIVSREQVTDVFFEEPQPWEGVATASPSAPTPTPPSRITPAAEPSKCLQTASPVPDLANANNRTVTACNPRTSDGYWTIKSDGTVRNTAHGTCLYNDGANSNNGNRVSTRSPIPPWGPSSGPTRSGRSSTSRPTSAWIPPHPPPATAFPCPRTLRA
ncbi:hypothetical protein ACWFQ8_07990 [Streptomyces sp. NPDC055254]